MSAVATPLLSSVILTVVFALMWKHHRERWLGYWAIASTLWFGRYAYALLLGEFRYFPDEYILPLFVLGRGLFLALGAAALGGRPLPRLWIALFVLDGALQIVEWVSGPMLLDGRPGVLHYVVFGLATAWAGTTVLRQRASFGGEAILVGVSFWVLALINGSFPWTSRIPAVVPWFLTIAHAGQLGIGFGALLLFYRRGWREREAAVVRLEEALSRALAGFLPICAHCKAIEGEAGEWQPLERYFSHRHDTAFSHGICPSCERTHYGELLETAS